MSNPPNPGSSEAIDLGCTCPVIDNARGRGYMGGAKGKDGRTVFVYTEGCPVHHEEVSELGSEGR